MLLKEKQETFTVTFDNQMIIEFPFGTSLLEIIQHVELPFSSPIVAAYVNNVEQDLNYQPDGDCNINFIELATDEGLRIYRRSLYFVLLKAAKDIFPNNNLHIEHSISTGVYCEMEDHSSLTIKDVQEIENKMWAIVKAKVPFVKQNFTKDEACRLMLRGGHSCKVRLMKYHEAELVEMYQCGETFENFNGVLIPNTGYLNLFQLKPYLHGFILLFPDKKHIDRLPEFKELTKLANTFSECKVWAKAIEVEDVTDFNEQITLGRGGDLVRLAEARQEKQISQIADCIAMDKENIRVILIAGPSSSGKTTFTQRLAIQLRVNGLKPVTISLDDYFVNRDRTPIDETGEYDFEAIDALDLPLFNEDLKKLIKGKEVIIPKFNFVLGEREAKGKPLKIDTSSVLLIEGIHGLNERLTASIPKEQKFKVYVSALTQLNIDNHNIIPTTDTRLIRRLVRDYYFRGSDAMRTLKVWPSVRRGEEKNIFPYQEEANVMFNTFLLYELSVLKPHALRLLDGVPQDSSLYIEARRLIKILNYFVNIDNEEIPTNSIIREFIGGCCFYQ
jgi:uridine kinase